MKRNLAMAIALMGMVAMVPIVYADVALDFKFGATGSGNDHLDNPTDVIVKSNSREIFVVDNNNDRINIFDDTGDADSRYGSFCDISKVAECNSRADGAKADGDGQFNGPLYIAMDGSGKYYVVDSANSRVQVFDDSGEFQLKFGSSDRNSDSYLWGASGGGSKVRWKEDICRKHRL